MHAPVTRHAHEVDARTLLRQLAPYRQASTSRALFELVVTIVPFALLWLLMLVTLQAGHLAGLLLALPAGAFLLRLFLIQHDCGHGAFFPRQAANDWLGRALGVLTLTPYDSWRRAHAVHHASTGNLDARGVGDVDTLSVEEFRSRSHLGRLRYRMYRHPLVLLGLGPAYLFLLRHRLPLSGSRSGWRSWVSAMGTNASIAVISGGLSWLIGLELFLLVHLPVVLVAASLGVWFFYVQHQFENTCWDRADGWSFHEAALHGSSYYELPGVLRWLSADIGTHHVHHLASRIPFYRLGEAMKNIPMLTSTNRVRTRECVDALRLALWDEQKRRLVSFDEAQGATVRRL